MHLTVTEENVRIYHAVFYVGTVASSTEECSPITHLFKDHYCLATLSFVWLPMVKCRGEEKRWRKKKGKKRWTQLGVIRFLLVMTTKTVFGSYFSLEMDPCETS